MVQNQFNSKIQVLKSDNAKEYFTSSLSTYLQNHDIIHISSCVDTPQQNGVAERKNRHLLEVARCLMFSSNVPNYFWGEAILTATYLINRMPSRVLTFQSPRQLFLKQFPHTRVASSDLPFKVFGCTAFVHVYPQNRSKFAPRANKCIFLGYSPTQKGYKCYSPTNKRFYTTMDVSFFEHVFFYTKFHVQGESMNEHQVWESRLEGVPSFHSESPNPSQFAPTELSTPMPSSVQPAQHTNVPSPVTIQSPMPIQPTASQLANENLQVYIRRRKRQELEHGSQSTCGQYIDSNSSLPEENIGEDRAGEVLIPSIDDSTLSIALRKGVRRCTDHPIGNYVTYEGLSPSYRAFATSLDDTQVPNTIQEALKISEWKKAVQDEIDALEKNGTWTITDLLVGRGLWGANYLKTFAPVAKLNTIRILLSLAVNQDWCLQQLDIKNAFLNGDLEEEVYMEIPPGFEESMAKNQVCKLQKSLYGLKQSPRAWFDRFTKAVLKLGYKQGQADHTLFVKKSHTGKMAILIVYVDDIILSGNDMEELQNLKKYLSKEFEVKDLGNLKYFLGMEVARSRKGIVVSQRKYILDLLKETGMLGCKPIDTPMDSQKKLGIEKESTPVDRGRYQRLVGRLIYLSHTRPDIGFAVSAVSQFMHSPTEEHMEAVYRILRYLKMTPGKGLFFKKTENRDTEVYSDADWAGNIIDRRSTSGYCSFVWGNLVTWRSKKQSVVARSSAEAEYKALAQGICEGIWIKRVLSELGQTSSSPILMMCDNQAAISIAKNPVHHDRTKHVEIDRHFITEKLDQEDLTFPQVATMDSVKENLDKSYVDSFAINSESRKISQSAPLFAEKKFDSARMREMRPLSTRKLRTYVLPTPDDTKSSAPTRSDSPDSRPIPTSLSGRPHNLWHSSPLEPKYEKILGDDKVFESTAMNAQSVLKESNTNHVSSGLPPPLVDGLPFRMINSSVVSDTKKVKRYAFSGPLTRNPWSTKPGHSAPLVASGPNLSATNKLVVSSTASRLPLPLQAVPRSFSTPSSGQKLKIPRVSGPSEAPQNSEMAENVTSPPLTPISLSNIQPASTSSVNDTSQLGGAE
ncbi:Retrovirus-related Pol polyprotein from transposon RE1 [Vitis vinifera]|uniref:Retrovirus-related Pol polyprotein from transposon RE1 n=1 Tax=Vitis vinifera TaxID=29760 RepID=A0A438D947_VITVI|nr:Retrovirus-related Pol polyprotein from transposon RE1 [Vitis vinifera]